MNKMVTLPETCNITQLFTGLSL